MIIKNTPQLARTQERKDALSIAEAGLEAISTEEVIKSTLILTDHTLTIQGKTYDLSKYKRIYVISFGKASCDALVAINQILHEHITTGIAIDIKTAHCENPNITFYQGSHPKPTPDNVIATHEITELSKDITQDDLLLCVVSGGGSSLLCASEYECDISNQIYDYFLKTGGDIGELNILRKHTSFLKGGRLAQIFYPATIIGLIFSDIPGGSMENVASGPTFKDTTTIDDAIRVVTKYNLPLKDIFIETPKDDKYFEKVDNHLLVSNVQAVDAMAEKAKSLGYAVQRYSDAIFGDYKHVAGALNHNLPSKTVRVAAGEPAIKIPDTITSGKGGRNQQLTIESMKYLEDNQVFIGIASDGIDNSDRAGGIVDKESYIKVKNTPQYKKAIESFDAYPLLQELNDQIETGPTGSNVSDLMIALKG